MGYNILSLDFTIHNIFLIPQILILSLENAAKKNDLKLKYFDNFKGKSQLNLKNDFISSIIYSRK